MDPEGYLAAAVTGYIIFAVGAVIAAVLIGHWVLRRRRAQKATGGRRW
jgi:hypothetical protein